MAEFDPDAFLAKREKRGGFDPDAFLAKTAPETAAQTFGRSAASLADTALNAITGTLDYGAYALARAAGRTPEQATAETTSPKDVVGRAFGVTGTQGYENAPLRTAGRYIGEGLQENVIQPVSSATGIPEADVGNMLNSLAMGIAPVAGKAAAPVSRTVKNVAQVPVDVARGAVGRATGYIAEPGATPKGYQVPSSRVPLGETYIPAEAMADLQRGVPISESAIRPISELAPGPIIALSGGEVPVAGQAARAFGERLGETYSNPYTAAADIGSMFLTGGVPVLTAGRGALGLAQAGADAYLARKGFTSLTPEQRAMLDAGGNPFYVPPTTGPIASTSGPVAPTEIPKLTYNPTPEPQVRPVAPETIYVDTQGGATTARELPASPQSFAERKQAMETMTTPQRMADAAELERQALIDKRMAEVEANRQQIIADQQIEQAAREAASQASKQKILDMIQAKKSQQPEVPSTTVQPVVPEELPAIGPAPAVTPSAEVMAAVPEMATKSLPEIRFDIKNTGKGAITTKNNIVQLDKTPYDDLAAMHGVKLDWAELGELKKGAADAREQVNKFVLDKIKEQRGPEKRGPQMRTLQKQAEKELGITGKEELTPEMKKRLGITDTPQPTPTISPALQALLDKQKAAGNYKPPGVSEMMTAPDLSGITDLTVYPSKQSFLEQQMIDKLAGKVTTGAYIENGKLYEHFYNATHRNAPESIKSRLGPEVSVVVTDLETGKVTKGGSGFKQQVENKLKKGK